MTKLHELARLGQSIWLDFIRRSLIRSGELGRLVDLGVRGMTSNPRIFEKAIDAGDEYDAQLRELAARGKSPLEIYEALAVKDVQDAADILRPVFEEMDGLDGYISLEANPHLANDRHATMDEIRRLRQMVNRPNVLYKIPATAEGLAAIEHLLGEGININITLMFSMKHYENVANAYLAGLEKFAASGGDVSKVASVASFFVSRVDNKVDKRLEEIGVKDLQGKIAIANAKNVYARFQEIFSGERWARLAAKGARVQRPLWASTSTKNPNYPDTLYVDSLIGPHTVNTVPPETVEAFLDHGTVAVTVDKNLDEARAQLQHLEALGIDLLAVGDELTREGVEQFAAPFDDLLATIERKRERLPQR